MRSPKYILLCIILALTFSAEVCLAHATGQSLIKKIGIYTIDVGYDSLTPSPIAGEPTAFDFLINDSEGKNFSNYSDISVDITQPGGFTVLYANIKNNPEGRTAMVYVFPQSGTYNLRVYYKREGQVFAQAEFPLTVQRAEYEQAPQSAKKYWTNFASGAVVGMLVLGCVVLFFGRKKKT